MTRLPIGTRVVVVRSDWGNIDSRGVVVRYAWGWNFPYLVRLDDGPEILTNFIGVQPIDAEEGSCQTN